MLFMWFLDELCHRSESVTSFVNRSSLNHFLSCRPVFFCASASVDGGFFVGLQGCTFTVCSPVRGTVYTTSSQVNKLLLHYYHH